MLMRDFGFRIYKHFASAPEIAEDERRDRDDHKDKARTKGSNKNEDSKVINDRTKSETAYSLKEPEESANSEHSRDTKAMRVEDNKISFESTQNSDKGQSLEVDDDGKVEDDVSCVDQVISAAINFSYSINYLSILVCRIVFEFHWQFYLKHSRNDMHY